MRRINPNSFGVARRGTSREVNRRILLTLIAAHQPVSRADLARLMDTNRASITLIVNQMIESGVISEGAVGQIARGRKPRLLQINARQSCVVAVDIRPTNTHLTLTDKLGNEILGHRDVADGPQRRAVHPPVGSENQDAPRGRLAQAHLRWRRRCRAGDGGLEGRVVLAPHLGWHDIPLAKTLTSRLGLPVKIENSGRACALAQIWMTREGTSPLSDLVYVSVSDGIGVGVIINGELVRGRGDSAGQFAHVLLSVDGPRCSCGANGCWET